MPEAVDAENLREVLDYYGTWLAFNQRYLRIPGVQAAVYAGDGIAFSGAYGLADVAQGVALTERHLFRIASHSKTFTATVASSPAPVPPVPVITGRTVDTLEPFCGAVIRTAGGVASSETTNVVGEL